jgi:hypothetical protein
MSNYILHQQLSLGTMYSVVHVPTVCFGVQDSTWKVDIIAAPASLIDIDLYYFVRVTSNEICVCMRNWNYNRILTRSVIRRQLDGCDRNFFSTVSRLTSATDE